MGTDFTEIYTVFLGKITEYGWNPLESATTELILEGYLKSARLSFSRLCKIDLLSISAGTGEEITKAFTETLTEEVIEILSLGMVYYWIEPYVHNSENFRNSLSTNDIKWFSPANILSANQNIREYALKRFNDAKIEYSYNHKDDGV